MGQYDRSRGQYTPKYPLDNYLYRLTSSGKSFSELLEFSDEQLQTLVFSEGATPKADERIDELKNILCIFPIVF